MTVSSIKRIGIVFKPHQPDALNTMCELVSWLSKRDIALLGGPEIERDRITEKTGCAVEQVGPEQLAASVDLVLVLGGDGTMIAAARMMGATEVPVLGVNYGGLGYLAEFRIEELYTRAGVDPGRRLSFGPPRHARRRTSARRRATEAQSRAE